MWFMISWYMAYIIISMIKNDSRNSIENNISALCNRRLNNNSLSGTIPVSLTTVTSLQVLWVLMWSLNKRYMFINFLSSCNNLTISCYLRNAGIFQTIIWQEIFQSMVLSHCLLPSGSLEAVSFEFNQKKKKIFFFLYLWSLWRIK